MRAAITIAIAIVVMVALGLLVYLLFDWSADEQTFNTYTDTTFSYQIDYPQHFTQQGGANGGERIFTSDTATLRVFAVENIKDEPLRTIAENYISADGESVIVADDTLQNVTLRSETDETTRAVKAILLPDDNAGIAVLEYEPGTLADIESDLILGSFRSTVSFPDDQDADDDIRDAEVGDGSGEVPVGYRVYENSQLEFSMLTPEDASVSMSGNDRVEIKFLGPDNEPNTEMTDGFLVTVFRDQLAEAPESPLAYAQRVYADTGSRGEDQITEQLEQNDINGMTAYRYAYRGALGNENTEYVFLTTDLMRGYRISYAVMDPNQLGYQGIVSSMLESVQFYTSATSAVPSAYESVELALLDYPASGTKYTNESVGQIRGCDRVVMSPRTIQPTAAPLTAALKELFGLDSEEYAGWQNFVANTNDTLIFERAAVRNGTAEIYLSGELSGLKGTCDEQRAKIQIEETALQFGTVDNVVLFLNNEETGLVPDARGT